MTGSCLLVLEIICTCSSTMMIFSPTPTIYRIYKAKNVGISSVVPLVAVLGNSHVWMLNGYLKDKIFPIFTNFLTGDIAAVIFIAIYYYYSEDRPNVLKTLAYELIALSLVTLYFVLALYGVTDQSREQSALIVGAIGIAFSLKLYGAGFERIVLVLKNKTAIYIPIHMVVMGTINNILWLVYTALDHNWLMCGSAIMCTTLSVSQLVLYVVYYPHGRRAANHTSSGPALVNIQDISITIAIPQFKPDDKRCIPESPVFHALRSPLSPLQVVEKHR
uniref:Bidirectional sugar transporter SWEET n=1 Tax=Globisporangium ultimum (strain ATCC 200006 / CBS 805.95 / DAOM BR144) TaxID=431595 RepID=K3X1W2_GLOUD